MTKTDHIARIRWLAVGQRAVALALLLSACSTYRGEKLGIVKDNPVAPSGIPYTLVRPEYTLMRTPPASGEKRPTYTLGVTYEASDIGNQCLDLHRRFKHPCL